MLGVASWCPRENCVGEGGMLDAPDAVAIREARCSGCRSVAAVAAAEAANDVGTNDICERRLRCGTRVR